MYENIFPVTIPFLSMIGMATLNDLFSYNNTAAKDSTKVQVVQVVPPYGEPACLNRVVIVQL